MICVKLSSKGHKINRSRRLWIRDLDPERAAADATATIAKEKETVSG